VLLGAARMCTVATILHRAERALIFLALDIEAGLMGSGLEDIRTHSGASTVSRQGEAFVRGLSPAMLTLESVVGDIARTNIPVLLVGESGSGKQMFAQRIHLLSVRADQEMAKVACASMKLEEFAAELERYESRAVGTVLFDEISELDSGCQRYLLHSLPDGDEQPRPKMLNARVISTTSQNLDEEMCAGRFRSELFYRMNGVCLRLPPLRERRRDIPSLAEFFMIKHATLFGRPRRNLSSRTLQIFIEYNWPGNIRQLENVVKNIVALGDEELSLAELATGPSEKRAVTNTPRSDSLKAAARAASREAERELILRALERTRWNRKRAARELQISYKSLLYKLKQIGLQDAEAN
jgi:two-component system, NtrC family, response regulator AtoC